MGIDLSKYNHLLFFVVVLPAISFGAGWGFSLIFSDLPFWVEGISPLGAYGLLYNFFDKVAWHWPIFKALGIVSVPDLRGRWIGPQVSSYVDKDGKNTVSHAVVEITQTFSKIATTTYYKRWETVRTDCCFMQIDGYAYLVQLFESRPGIENTDDRKHRQGVCRMALLPDGTLEGRYFNDSGNSGTVTLTRSSLTLQKKF